MTELADFRNALSAAGQPWSRWGIRTVGAGVAALLALQLIPRVPYALYALIGAMFVVAAGWVMMIKAVLMRRRWAKANPVADVPLDPTTLTGAP